MPRQASRRVPLSGDLRRVTIRVPAERGEEARARFLELSPDGFEERDDGAHLELAAYTDEDGERRLRSEFGDAESEPVEPGWEDTWRAFHRPVRIGPLWVGPPWLDPEPGAVPVMIDPGQAFGTGAHATTHLCLELLLEAERGSLVDLGCGSGVIAIAAVKLGFAPVTALDSDEVAVRIARENAAANGVDLAIRYADVLTDDLPETEISVANIELATVEALASRVRARILVTSGYPGRERPSLPGWEHDRRAERDGWAADLHRRE